MLNTPTNIWTKQSLRAMGGGHTVVIGEFRMDRNPARNRTAEA